MSYSYVQILSIICVACPNNENWSQYARTVSQYRSIQCSYLHTFLFEWVYEQKPTEFPGFRSLENRRRGEGGGGWGKGVSHPCSAVWVYPVLDTHTSSDRKLSYSGPSQYELEEYSFLLCRFLYTIDFTTLPFFCDCYGFLKKKKIVLFLS